MICSELDFWGHIGSSLIICMPLYDCCCLFRALIQSPSFLWWTWLNRTKKKHTYLYVFYVATSEECVKATPALKKKSQVLYFSAVRKYFFWGLILFCSIYCSSQIESSLARIRFESYPQVLRKEQAEEIQCMNVQFWKSHTYFHKYAASQRTSIVDVAFRWGIKWVSVCLRPSEKKFSVSYISK